MLIRPMVGFIIRKKQWTEYLPNGFVMQVYLNTILGKIVSFSVVLIKDDECISRYDTAHGYAHRDVLGRKSSSPLNKISYNMLTLGEVFRYAREDFSKNYEKYYDYFETH
jgi:hypothetical protein